MPRITAIQVVYNNKRFMEPVFSAILNQTFKDIHVVAVISGSEDGGREFLREKFPQVEIIDPGYNIGFAAGHNLIFERGGSEFYQLVNPDLILEPDYIEKMLKVFDDPWVGAATGKLYKIPELGIRNYELWKEQNLEKILDTTGVTISKSGRARDRGQHEVDNGQYDSQIIVDAVSGAGPMYRATALTATSLPKFQNSNNKSQINFKFQISNFKTEHEYFDEDFHSYWEDVDLAWRMRNRGWKCAFVPSAVGYHGRGAGSSKNGYSDVMGFIKHHKQLSPRVRQLNFKNHIFMYVKNSEKFYLSFFVREFFMLIYILLLEPATLKIFPEFLKCLPKMWKKRKIIQTRTVT